VVDREAAAAVAVEEGEVVPRTCNALVSRAPVPRGGLRVGLLDAAAELVRIADVGYASRVALLSVAEIENKVAILERLSVYDFTF
jgi:hypothetical protein